MRCSRTNSTILGVMSLLLGACPGDSSSDDEIGSSESGNSGTDTTGTDTGEEPNCGVLGSGGPSGAFVAWESIEILVDASSCPVFAADPRTPGFLPYPVQFLFPVTIGETLPPDGEYPLLMFQHGNLQNAAFYDYLWDAIVPEGMFVANLDTIASSNLDSRMLWYRCAIEYFGTQWPDPQFLAEKPEWPVGAVLDSRLVLAGHSMSGEAALRVAATTIDTPNLMHGFELQGLITMAPREGDSGAYQFPPWASVDYLGLSGSIDNDVPGGALRIHELAGDDQGGPDPGASKTLVWAYDVAHGAFGGIDPMSPSILADSHYGVLTSSEMHAKGQAVTAPYVLAFLRRLWFEPSDQADLRLLRGEELAPEVFNPAWWSYLDASEGGAPVIRVSHVDGCETDRIVIDDFARSAMNPLSPSSEGLDVILSGDLSTVAVTPLATLPRSHQYTSVLDIAWQDGESGSVEWNLAGIDAGAATHLSFRVANIADIHPSVQPGMEGMCVVNQIFPALQFDVVVLGAANNSFSIPVSPTPQDYETVAWAQNPLIDICASDNMMSEVVIPLAEACGVYPIHGVRLEFGASSGGGHVHLDNLELRVRDATPPCP
jgi:hypothetical protein